MLLPIMTITQPSSSALLSCESCGATGYVMWDSDGLERRPTALDRGFHYETGRTTPNKAILVCDACDSIHPD